MEARGLAIDFTRLHLRGLTGLGARNLTLRNYHETNGPSLKAVDAALDLGLVSLLLGDVEVKGIRISEGELAWPLPGGTAGEKPLVVRHISTEISLGPQGELELQQFKGDMLGSRIYLKGSITNIMQAAPAQPNRTTADFSEHLRSVITTLEGFRYDSPPDLRLNFSGDAATPGSFRAHLRLNAASAAGRIGRLRNLKLTAQVEPAPDIKGGSSVHWDLNLASLRGRGWFLEGMRFQGDTAYPYTNPAPFRAGWLLNLK